MWLFIGLITLTISSQVTNFPSTLKEKHYQGADTHYVINIPQDHIAHVEKIHHITSIQKVGLINCLNITWNKRTHL